MLGGGSHIMVYCNQNLSHFYNISGCEYFAEMMEIKDRLLAQNCKKLSCKLWFFP